MPSRFFSPLFAFSHNCRSFLLYFDIYSVLPLAPEGILSLYTYKISYIMFSVTRFLLLFCCAAVQATNDWLKPCVRGECFYDLPATKGVSGTMRIVSWLKLYLFGG